MIKKHTSILLLCLTISVTAFTGQVWADQMNTDVSGVATSVPSIQIDVNNPYITAGIDDAKAFSDFYIGLKKAVSEGNSKDVSEFMSYPLNLIKNGQTTIIYTKEQFVQKYDRIITSNVRKQLLDQNIDNLFINAKGVRIGDGSMWISQINNRIVVYSINAVDNPYEVAGIDDPKAFTQFLSNLQNSVRSNDKKAVAELMYYPLNVNKNGKTTKIYTSKQFVSKYDQVITKRVKQQLLAQKVDKLFVNSEGVMIGNGEMWISQFGKKIAVFAINL